MFVYTPNGAAFFYRDGEMEILSSAPFDGAATMVDINEAQMLRRVAEWAQQTITITLSIEDTEKEHGGIEQLEIAGIRAKNVFSKLSEDAKRECNQPPQPAEFTTCLTRKVLDWVVEYRTRK